MIMYIPPRSRENLLLIISCQLKRSCDQRVTLWPKPRNGRLGERVKLLKCPVKFKVYLKKTCMLNGSPENALKISKSIIKFLCF